MTIRPISIDVVPLVIQLVLCGIFLLTAWIVYRKASNEKDAVEYVPLILSMAVGLILPVIYGISLMTVKGMILALVLLYASISDLKTRKVSDFVFVMILILAFVGFEIANLPSMLVGAAVVFIPQFSLALARPGRACGGADLKISTALAFMLGAEKGIFALVFGMFFAVTVMTIYNKVKAKSQKEAFPLVPFLSIGAMLAYII